jgi:hypothetical protein
MAFVGEERRLVEGRGSESFVVGVGRGAVLDTIIIGTICNKVTSLTAFEAGALSLCFVLVGVLLASLSAVLKRLMISVISSSLRPAAST